jgi:methylated-DNA-[protein]-cysteine S-methyltransferase
MIAACLFPTPIGTCGLAWSAAGLRAVQLPDATEERLVRRLRRLGASLVDAPEPGLAAEAARRLTRHLQGERDSLQDLPLDLEGAAPFSRAVYQHARAVLPGQTISYGELARRCGRPGGAQAVGQVMAHNPFAIVVPCHRVLAAGGGLGGFSCHGTTGTKLRLLTLEGADLSEVAAAGTRELGQRDPRLRPIIRRVGPYSPHWAQREDRFTALCEAIVHQQVSMAAGATIFRRVLEACGGGARLAPARLLAVPAAELRAAGLSRQKASYLRDLAARTREGTLALDRLALLDDEQVIAELTQVKGIGRWSAEMFLIFRLGRLDVLPVDDLGLRKGVQRLRGNRTLPGADEVRRQGERWRPFRSIATWYLWRYQDAGGLSD